MSVTPDEFILRVGKRVNVGLRDWALGNLTSASLDLPLRPPPERDVIADLDGALRWAESWQTASEALPIQVTWVQRAWARVGTQRIPDRVRADGPEALTALVGESERWQRWTARVALLRDHLGTAIDDALRVHLRDIGNAEESDFEHLIAAVDWLVEHPDSGLRLRELPLRGVDTKWLERRRAVVQSLTLVVTGRDSLGLNEGVDVARIRLLDPDESVGGLRDVSAPIDEFLALTVNPRVVLIVENLQTFLSLPMMEGVIAVYGQGNAVVGLARIPWLRSSRILYWGDLDSHGFRILNLARSVGLDVESVLMDSHTLHEHRDLWVAEPQPFVGVASFLTEPEITALTELRACGHVRLEQERIPWEYALQALRGAVQEIARC